MSKARFFLPFLFAVLSSCGKQSDPKRENSSGPVNSISVIIDDQLWNGEIGDTLRNKFASPVIGLPQEEPLFSINQYPVKLLEGFTSNSRNIIIVKKDSVRSFSVVRDEFAKRQNVFHISGRTVAEIIELIEKNAPKITRMMKDAEIAQMQKLIDTSLLDIPKIREEFAIDIRIPSSYKVVLKGDGFVWLKREIISGNTSLLIYSAPLRCLERNANPIYNIVKMRDSIGALYIHGTVADSRMITEEAYAPYLAQTTFRGLKTYETRGTWELKNDFMSGPFLNFAIKDKPNNRLLVIEGFCYAPSKEKRDLMHELEAIIRSVEIKTLKNTSDAAKMENKAL